MSESGSNFPDRLRAAGASDFQRRLLEAAAREEPSRELTERMAQAIGVSAPTLTASQGEAPAGMGAAAPNAAGTLKGVLSWIAGMAIIAATVAAIIATNTHTSPQPPTLSTSRPVRATAPVVAPPVVPMSSTTPDDPPAAPREDSPGLSLRAPAQRSRPLRQGTDLQEQIALIDAARTAVLAGAGARALEVLSEYKSKYPAGSFRPEAAALKVEALARLGRTEEARVLAERFVAEHGGTPLADRVARVAGLRSP